MPASLKLTFTLTDGTALELSAPMTDADVARFVSWGLADTQRLPTEHDDKGGPLPRDVPWVLRRLTEAFLADTFAKVANWEHQKALAAVQQPAPIPVALQ